LKDRKIADTVNPDHRQGISIPSGKLTPSQIGHHKAPAFDSSKPATPASKKHLRKQVLFAVKFVPSERVKYAGACEIACGSEIRLRRVGERISFHIDRREIFHNFRKEIISHSPQGEYFTKSFRL
jgi:hypothetical protein